MDMWQGSKAIVSRRRSYNMQFQVSRETKDNLAQQHPNLDGTYIWMGLTTYQTVRATNNR